MAQTSRTTTWVNDILTGLAAASGVGYLATAYSISRWLTRPTPAQVEPPPELADCQWETLTCPTADGLTLSGWVASPPQPRGTVALFHGLRKNRAEHLDRIAFLVRAGWRCLAFDHRAHGSSQGKLPALAQGIGFAVPSKMISPILAQIRDHGRAGDLVSENLRMIEERFRTTKLVAVIVRFAAHDVQIGAAQPHSGDTHENLVRGWRRNRNLAHFDATDVYEHGGSHRVRAVHARP